MKKLLSTLLALTLMLTTLSGLGINAFAYELEAPATFALDDYSLLYAGETIWGDVRVDYHFADEIYTKIATENGSYNTATHDNAIQVSCVWDDLSTSATETAENGTLTATANRNYKATYIMAGSADVDTSVSFDSVTSLTLNGVTISNFTKIDAGGAIKFSVEYDYRSGSNWYINGDSKKTVVGNRKYDNDTVNNSNKKQVSGTINLNDRSVLGEDTSLFFGIEAKDNSIRYTKPTLTKKYTSTTEFENVDDEMIAAKDTQERQYTRYKAVYNLSSALGYTFADDVKLTLDGVGLDTSLYKLSSDKKTITVTINYCPVNFYVPKSNSYQFIGYARAYVDYFQLYLNFGSTETQHPKGLEEEGDRAFAVRNDPDDALRKLVVVIDASEYLFDGSKMEDHTYELNNSPSVTHEATCTALGVTTYTCSVCGYSKKETMPALGHIEAEAVKENITEPTCVTAGKYDSVVYCARCGKNYTFSREKDIEMPATGVHTWNAGVETKAATVTEEGVKTYTCTVCSTTKTESIPKLTPVEPVVTEKKANPLSVKAKKPTLKASKLKKKKLTLALKKWATVKNAQGKVTYKISSAKKGKKNFKKYFKVAKNGKVTVKKGLKKGTYKLKIKVTAAGNDTYEAITKTVTVTIKVK